jgi:DNA-binding NtrC family response regulator
MIRPAHLPKNLPSSPPPAHTLDEIVTQAQRTAIENALEQTGGKVADAAKLLGRNAKGLYRLMKTLGMPVKRRK